MPARARDLADPVPPRRRLPAQERKREIVVHAATVFAELGPDKPTTADVADAAGVTRALVHHHFGGIAEVYAAVVAYATTAFDPALPATAEGPLSERIAREVGLRLDAIKRQSGLWLATAGNPFPPSDPQVYDALDGFVERGVDRMLIVYGDRVRDTRNGRAALRAFVRFEDSTTRQWLLGSTTRAFTERLILSTLEHLLEELPGPR